MPDSAPRVYVGDAPGQYVVEGTDGALHLVPDRWRGWRQRRPYGGSREALQPVPGRVAWAIAVRLGALPRGAAAGPDRPEPGPAPAPPARPHPTPPASGHPVPGTRAPHPNGAAGMPASLVDAVAALTAALQEQRAELEGLAARLVRLEALRAGDREALRQVAAIDREVGGLRRELGATEARLTRSLEAINAELDAHRRGRPAGRWG
jgi:hypothetical protein